MNTSDEGIIPNIQTIAASMRAIRKSRNLTLKQVEEESKGTWKAVVIGSYERCDRALSLNKAIALAAFYRVPLDELLGIATPIRKSPQRLTFDMLEVNALKDPALLGLKRFLASLVSRRRDWNGQVYTIRENDHAAVSALLNIPEEKLHDSLKRAGLIFSELKVKEPSHL